MATTKSSTIKRYNGADYDTINPITIGQNIYGNGTNLTTPLLDSNDKINSAFLNAFVSSVNGSSGAITNVAKTNTDNNFSVAQTFSSKVQLTNANHYIQKGSGNVVEIGANGSAVLTIGSSSTAIASVFRANSDNSKDLGTSSIRWKDIYLGGKIKTGTSGAIELTLPSSTGQIALVSDIPEGDVDVTINGTATSTVETLSNIIVGTTTYKNLTTFTGTSTTTGTASGTTEVASSSHTHTVTGSVGLSGSRTTSGSGTTARRTLTITGSFSSGTTSAISGTTSVASSGHNHTFTAQGSLS